MSFPPIPGYSKSKINKSALRLSQRKKGFVVRSLEEEHEALDVVNSWRVAHQYPLNTFNANLRDKVKNIRSAIVAQRLKRLPTILDKLNREPSMQLTTMNDIAGVRTIVTSINDVYRVVNKFKKAKKQTHILLNEHDYIQNPRKTDGYRSVHLVYSYENHNPNAEQYKGLRVEVQVRTKFQHYWATTVETTGVMLGQQLKSRIGEKAWLDFFASVSNVFSIMEKTTRVPGYEKYSENKAYQVVRDRARALNVIDRLQAFSAATQFIETGGNKVGRPKNGYFLLVLDANKKTVQIIPYSRDEAEKASADLEDQEKTNLSQQKDGKDAVLVSVGPLDDLKKAYPNYFLDVSDFVRLLKYIIDKANSYK